MVAIFNAKNYIPPKSAGKNPGNVYTLPMEVAQVLCCNYAVMKPAFNPELLDDVSALTKLENNVTYKSLTRAAVIQEMYKTNFDKEGWIHIYTRKDDGHFNLIRTCKPSEVYACMLSMDFGDNKTEYYITKNTMKGSKRGNGYVFSLHNIVIDIDIHKPELSGSTGRMMLIQEVEKLYIAIASGGMDKIAGWMFPPTLVVNTGRGVQVWWNIEQASYNTAKSYKALAKMLER